MQRSRLAIFLAVSLVATALFAWTGTARADRRHGPRGYGPVVVIVAGPSPYYRRYGGPPPGVYGSPYYGVANSQMFGPSAAYLPYGAGAARGYAYPPGYTDPYGVHSPPSTGTWEPYSNPLLQATMLENQLRWGTALPPRIPDLRTRARLRPSTPEQQVKSLHAQAQGDVWMKKLRFLNAYERYKVAQGAASDRPEPYFRLGFSLAAVASFDSAVKYIKQGLELDPQWPSHGDRLETLFGEDNRLSVLTLIERVGGWAREDIRDPDRLFLMGVVLHFDGDSRASEFFEAAYRLAGSGDHLLAFLHPMGGPEAGPMNPGGPMNSGGPMNPGGPMNSGGPMNPGGPNPGRSGFVFGPGMANGASPAPQPQEPQNGAPQMVAPPDFGPGGEPQGMFTPQQPPPRGMYQPLPPRQRPAAPWNSAPWNSGPRNPPDRAMPPQGAPPQVIPQQRTPPPTIPQPSIPQQGSPPPGTPPQNTKPAGPAPQLPVPPLPAPEEPTGEPQTKTQGAPPLDGPDLGLPTSGTVSGSTTVQSP
jgi:hypothetical protein